MKVAIIGAGLSGLSCAHELKRNGIIPTIFEKKSYIGEAFDYQSIVLNPFSFPNCGNTFKMLKSKYNIDIKPQYLIKEAIMHSPNKREYSAKGKMGFIIKRGKEPDSIENRLHRQSTFRYSLIPLSKPKTSKMNLTT